MRCKDLKEFWWAPAILLIVINFTWFVTEPDGQGNVVPVFNNHNLPFIGLFIVCFIILELAFVIFVKFKNKPITMNWGSYVLKYKFISLIIASSIFWLFLPLVFVIQMLYDKKERVAEVLLTVMLPFLICILVILWVYSNYFIAKKFGKEKPRKYVVGQKVTVRNLYTWCNYNGRRPTEQMEKLERKVVTIKEYLEQNELKIKEDKGKFIWTEEMFE